MKIHLLLICLLLAGPVFSEGHLVSGVRGRKIAHWDFFEKTFHHEKVKVRFPRKPQQTSGGGVQMFSSEKGGAMYTLSLLEEPETLDPEVVFSQILSRLEKGGGKICQIERNEEQEYPTLDVDLKTQLEREDSDTGEKVVYKTFFSHLRIVVTEENVVLLETVHEDLREHEHELFSESLSIKRKKS